MLKTTLCLSLALGFGAPVLADFGHSLNGGFGRQFNGFGGAEMNQPSRDNGQNQPGDDRDNGQGEGRHEHERGRERRDSDDHGGQRIQVPARGEERHGGVVVTPRDRDDEHGLNRDRDGGHDRDAGHGRQLRNPGGTGIIINQGHGGWQGDIRHFRHDDLNMWRGGHWFHGHHHNHPGWWWIVGADWYFYPMPAYPYPTPYVPGMLIDEDMAPDEQQPQYWYYCEDPQGYYPYVAVCNLDWEAVPVPAEEE